MLAQIGSPKTASRVRTHLASGVNDLRHVVLILVSNIFAKCIFDSGIIGFDEDAIDKLNRE